MGFLVPQWLDQKPCQGNLLIAEGGLRVVLADFDLSVKTQGLHVAKCWVGSAVYRSSFYGHTLGKSWSTIVLWDLWGRIFLGKRINCAFLSLIKHQCSCAGSSQVPWTCGTPGLAILATEQWDFQDIWLMGPISCMNSGRLHCSGGSQKWQRQGICTSRGVCLHLMMTHDDILSLFKSLELCRLCQKRHFQRWRGRVFSCMW